MGREHTVAPVQNMGAVANDTNGNGVWRPYGTPGQFECAPTLGNSGCGKTERRSPSQGACAGNPYGMEYYVERFDTALGRCGWIRDESSPSQTVFFNTVLITTEQTVRTSSACKRKHGEFLVAGLYVPWRGGFARCGDVRNRWVRRGVSR